MEKYDQANTHRERRLRDQLEKELHGLSHEEILYEGWFRVEKIILLHMMENLQCTLYLDKWAGSRLDTLSDQNNFIKQSLLTPNRGFLAVGEQPGIMERDLLKIACGYNINCNEYFLGEERRKIYDAVGAYSNRRLWVPLLSSISKIKRPFLNRCKKVISMLR